MDVNMAAQKKKKQKTTYYQVTPQATTEQQLRIQKMRDELNAPDPNDPHVFTRYKKKSLIPLWCCFRPYALYRIWCKKQNSTNGKNTCKRRSVYSSCFILLHSV